MTTRSPTLLSVHLFCLFISLSLSLSLSLPFWTKARFLPPLSTRSFRRAAPRRLPPFASHPRGSAALRARASYTLLPAYRRGVLAASHATYRDCLAAFTRRLLTGGRYSVIPYYAFVRGRFSSIPLISPTYNSAVCTPLPPPAVPMQPRGRTTSLRTHRIEQRPGTQKTESRTSRKRCARAAFLPCPRLLARARLHARSMGTRNRPVFRDNRILTELLAS